MKRNSAEKRQRDDDRNDKENLDKVLSSSNTSTSQQQHVKKKCAVGNKLTLPIGMQPLYVITDDSLHEVMKGLKQRLRQVCDSQVIRSGGLLYMSLDMEWTVRGKGETQV